MRNPIFVARAVGLLTLTLVWLTWHAQGHAADLKLPDPAAATPSAAQLVEQALQSELAGDADQRAVLLKQALELDANYAPARWHSGFVMVDGDWLSLDQAARRAAADPQLAAYRKRRDALVDTADNQREMARWCAKHKLTDEARIHWAKVLEFNPQDAEALAGLNVEFYQGQLLTKSQMIEAKKRAGERMKATRHWQPKLVKWRKAIENGHVVDRQAAMEGLRKLDDLDALAAVEAVFAVDEDSERGRELNMLLLQTVGRFQHPEATQILLRRALIPDSEAIRGAACESLKKRPMYAYVPQLIGLMPEQSSWTLEWRVQLLADRGILLQSAICRKDGQQELQFTYSALSDEQEIRNLWGTRVGVNKLGDNLSRALRALSGLRSNVAQFEQDDQQRDAVRKRVQFALARTTGFESVDSRDLYLTKYNEANGWGSSTLPESSARRTTQNLSESFVTFRAGHSCFPPGTPVLTQQGLKPIETIQVGDRVASQDARTGEILFKPVQTTTLRPATPMIALTINDVTLRATRGHPFWIAGQGWEVGKRLEPGDRLHGLNGGGIVQSIDSSPETEVYNLVVSDFHNYFVGEQLLLVHDNSPIAEATSLLPGLIVHAASP